MNETKNVTHGDNITVHYRGTLDDGSEFDNSHKRGEAMAFKVGEGEVIPGIDKGVIGMEIGDVKSISISPDDAFGPRHEDSVRMVPKQFFGPDFVVEIDSTVQGDGPDGPILAKVISEQNDTITLDFNHPLAGKELNFEVELLEIDDSPQMSEDTGGVSA